MKNIFLKPWGDFISVSGGTFVYLETTFFSYIPRQLWITGCWEDQDLENKLQLVTLIIHFCMWTDQLKSKAAEEAAELKLQRLKCGGAVRMATAAQAAWKNTSVLCVIHSVGNPLLKFKSSVTVQGRTLWEVLKDFAFPKLYAQDLGNWVTL